MKISMKWFSVTSLISLLCASCSSSSSDSNGANFKSQALPSEVSFDSVRYNSVEIKGFNKPFDAVRDSQGNLIVLEFPLRKFLHFNDQNEFFQWTGVGGDGEFVNGWQPANTYSTGEINTSVHASPHAVMTNPGNPSKFLVTYWGDNSANANIISQYDLATGVFESSFGMVSDGDYSQGFTPEKKIKSGSKFFVGLVNSTFDSFGNFYVSDFKANAIVKFDTQFNLVGAISAKTGGGVTTQWSKGYTPVVSKEVGGFDRPHNIAFDSKQNFYVTDTWNHRIQKFDVHGRYLGWLGATNATSSTSGFVSSNVPAVATDINGGFNGPIALRIDAQDNLYVLEYSGGRLQKFNKDGLYLDKITGFSLPYGLYLSESEMIVTDTSNKRVVIYKKL
jgi:hypothetical protein